jgi:hypothetical protein
VGSLFDNEELLSIANQLQDKNKLGDNLRYIALCVGVCKNKYEYEFPLTVAM